MLTNPRKLLTIQRLLSIIRPYKPLHFIFPSLDGRGKGRVDGYGVITVRKPSTIAIVLNKDSSGGITVSFHYDPQLVEKAVKSTPMSVLRVLGK